jgi:hypothetical protein
MIERFSGQGKIADADRSGLGNEATIQMQQNCGFSGPVRPHDRNSFSMSDPKRNPVKGGISIRIRIVQIL